MAEPKAEPKPETKIGIKPVPENTERVYDPDEVEYFLTQKTFTKFNNKDIIKPKTEPQPKPKEYIYTRFKFECKECQAEFKNKIALTTHS